MYETQEAPTTLRQHRHNVQGQASNAISVLGGIQGLSQEQQVAKLNEAQRYLIAAQAAVALAITFAEERDFSAVAAAKQAKKDQQLSEFNQVMEGVPVTGLAADEPFIGIHKPQLEDHDEDLPEDENSNF